MSKLQLCQQKQSSPSIESSCHCPPELSPVINGTLQRRFGESFWDGHPVASLSRGLPSPLSALESARKEEMASCHGRDGYIPFSQEGSFTSRASRKLREDKHLGLIAPPGLDAAEMLNLALLVHFKWWSVRDCKVKLIMVLPRKYTSTLGLQDVLGEGNSCISWDFKARSDIQGWAGHLSHLASLPVLSGSCNPRSLVLIFDTPLNLTKIQKRNHSSGYNWSEINLSMSNTWSKNV